MSAAVAVSCRCCGSVATRSRGIIPDATIFAGRQLEKPLRGGALHRCADCGFVFRHPIYSKAEYDGLYLTGQGTVWEEPGRIDQQIVRDLLTNVLADGAVLDVGCAGGSLLAPLTDRYRSFGVEINPSAARLAQARGVRVLAADFEETAALPYEFDAVVCCDLIEHVARPLDLLRLLLAKTRPGGWVIVSTGNTEAWSWRLVGSRFWYCYLPEHISFVSPGWFAHHAAGLGTELAAVRRFTYTPRFSLAGRLLRLAFMGLYGLSPTLYYGVLPRDRRDHIPVGRGITRDHFVVALRKQSAGTNGASARRGE